jgi:hypothetical protein
MQMPSVSKKQQRDIQRVVHLVGAAVLVVYIYAPLDSAPLVTALMQAVIVPVLGITGLLMWQGPRLRNLIQGRDSSTSGHGNRPPTTAGRHTKAL